MKRKWFRALLRRRFIVIVLLLVQIAFFIYSLFLGSQISETIRIVLKVISFVAISNYILPVGSDEIVLLLLLHFS